MASLSACMVIVAAIALLLTEPLRRLACRMKFIDNPGAHKSHVVPVPYLGGLALTAGTVGGAISRWGEGRLTLVVGLACVLAAVGLLDDRFALPAPPRFAAQGVTAVILVATGTSIGFTGVGPIDFVATVLAVVVVVNVWNFLDNMDGLSSGLTAVTGAVLAVLGAVKGDLVVATIGAALAGSAIGFLAFNAPPAAIYLGDTGSLFAGFLVAAAAVDISPTTPAGTAPLVAGLLLGVPAVDIVVVSLARIRRGISLTTGGRNHLSHRFVALGLGRGSAVVVLVGAQLATTTVAVLLATRTVSALSAAALGIAILAPLVAVTVRAVVFAEPIVRFHHPRVAIGLAIAVFIIAVGPMVTARAGPTATIDQLSTALAAGDVGATVRGRGCGPGETVAFESDGNVTRVVADHRGRFETNIEEAPGSRVVASCSGTRFVVTATVLTERPHWGAAALCVVATLGVSAAIVAGRRRKTRVEDRGVVVRRTEPGQSLAVPPIG